MSLVSSSISSYFSSNYSSTLCAAFTVDGSALSLVGSGVLDPLSNLFMSVMMTDQRKHNCVSVARLTDVSFSVIFLRTMYICNTRPIPYPVSSLVACISFL